jgi:Fe-S-cluster containining protein
MRAAFAGAVPSGLHLAVTRVGANSRLSDSGVGGAASYSLLEPLGRSPVMRNMRNTYLEYGCVKCCLNTEMELSSSDIRQIRSLGFSESFFIVKKNGKRQLKNSAGRCVFHNGRRCTIYNDRPEGCRLYPIILREDTGETALDSYCPHRGKFQLTSRISREVIKLVRTLDVETKRRLRSGGR